MNAPDRFEKFVVPDHLRKVEYKKDTKLMNAGTFIFQREDHTIGNILRMKLLEDPNVLFAGYKIPHPLEYQMVVKVQTNGRNGYTPVQAVAAALNSLSEEYDDILTQFQTQAQDLEVPAPMEATATPYHY